MRFIRLIINKAPSELPVHALPTGPALVLLPLPAARESAAPRKAPVEVAKVRVPLLIPRIVRVRRFRRDAPEPFVDVVPRLHDLVHLPRRPHLAALGMLIRVPLQRGFFVRLFYKVATPVLSELREVLRQV